MVEDIDKAIGRESRVESEPKQAAFAAGLDGDLDKRVNKQLPVFHHPDASRTQFVKKEAAVRREGHRDGKIQVGKKRLDAKDRRQRRRRSVKGRRVATAACP